MKRSILLLVIIPVLLLSSCGDGDDYYNDTRSLVGLWGSSDYRILPADPPQNIKLYILPDKQFYFLYFTNLTDTIPLNNSARGVIVSNFDVNEFPQKGMFFEIQIQEVFDGAVWNASFQNLNIYIDELGLTNFRFQKDANWNFWLEETGDEMGYFVRIVE